MPSHATRVRPGNTAFRRAASTHRTVAVSPHIAASATASARRRREHGREAVQPQAKRWHIALGMIALLCSGIDLG